MSGLASSKFLFGPKIAHLGLSSVELTFMIPSGLNVASDIACDVDIDIDIDVIGDVDG